MEPSITIKPLKTGATIHIADFGPAKIHTYVAPEDSFGDTTHIIESDNNLLIVDSQYLIPYAKEVRAYANNLGKPIAGIIISHAHPDHYFGLGEFADVPSYALPEVIKDIEQSGNHMIEESKKGLGDLVPDKIVIPQNPLSVGETNIDGIQYRFDRYTNAEADSQLVIELPQLGAVIVQDIVYNGYHPWLGKTVPNWISTLKQFNQRYKNYPYVFAGHGQPTLHGCYDQMIGYLTNAIPLLMSGDKDKVESSLVKMYPNLKGRKLIPLYLGYM